MSTEFYVVANLGYDGTIISKFENYGDAYERYYTYLTERRAWDAKYPESPCTKGVALIRGEVVAVDSPDYLW